jgi:ABC-2 type transport system permease protein
MSAARIKLLIRQEFARLRRDRLLLGMLIAMPILQLILFGYVVSAGITPLRTAVVDLDHSAVSAQVTQAFENSGHFVLAEHPAGESELRPVLDNGEIRIAVVIPEMTAERLSSGETTEIGSVVDGSNYPLSQVAVAYASSIVASLDTGSDTGAGIDAQVQFSPEIPSANTMIPGLVAAILMLSLTMVMSIAVARDRESGSLEPLAGTPIRSGEYLIGKVTPYAGAAILQLLITTVGGCLWFQVPFNGNLLIAVIGLLLFLLLSAGTGLLISLLWPDRTRAHQALVFLMILAIVLSGFLFPIDSMPAHIGWISNLIPLTHALTVLRGSFEQDAGWPAMVQPLLILLGFAVLIFGSAVAATRKRMED